MTLENNIDKWLKVEMTEKKYTTSRAIKINECGKLSKIKKWMNDNTNNEINYIGVLINANQLSEIHNI